MSNHSRLLAMSLTGALALGLLAGCGSTPNRYGAGNDHEVANMVYVPQPAPTVVYYQPAPVYSTTPA